MEVKQLLLLSKLKQGIKYKVFWSFVMASLVIIAQNSNLVEFSIDGTYQGKELYVQNPFNPATNSFCIKKVTVNGQEYKDINSSAFAIDFKQFNLKKGQYVEVKIYHEKGCQPRVLNPTALIGKSTFELLSFKADEEHVRWTTRNETSEEPFYLEREEYGRWKVIAKVKGKGPGGYNNYVVKVKHFSGVNKYRIKQRDVGGQWRYTEVLEYKSKKKPVSFYPKRVTDKLFFTDEVDYEIYDETGKLVKKGSGKEVNVTDLKPGVYIVYFDNRSGKFLKK